MRLGLLISLLLLALPAHAIDGKWMPEQLLSMNPQWLRSQGLEVPASSLWNAEEGTGLLSAAVSLGGCSAAFVSPDGLIITNHHCLFSLIQQHSSPERDLIGEGFLAKTRAEELPGKAERVFVPRRFRNVTSEFHKIVAAHKEPMARYEAIDKRKEEMENACSKPPTLRCDVRIYDDGRIYMLVETVELMDVRLVYAPPSGVGNFGGEVDNWMWPRHSGDFAIARAYVAPDGTPRPHDAKNVPYKPRFHFPLSTEGVSPGDFVAILGYPGSTSRRLVAAELNQIVEDAYPAAHQAYGEWLAILDDVAKTGSAARIATANTTRTWSNRYKNLAGQLEGFEKRGLIERQNEREAEILAFARAQPKLKPALEAHEELGRLAAESSKTRARDFLLSTLSPRTTSPSKALWMAVQVVRVSHAKQLSDAERLPDMRERELPRLLSRLETEQRSVSLPAEQRMMAWFADRARQLPASTRIEGFDKTFGKRTGRTLDTSIRTLLRRTKVLDPTQRAQMLTQTPEQLKARRDPLLNLAFSLAESYEALVKASQEKQGALYALRPAWQSAVIAQTRGHIAPDANSTLRISIGKVQGYTQRDAVWMKSQTTLSGMLAKHTGEDPFDVPEKVRKAAANAGASRWRDATLHDVPVNFLADLDTTGGNSGSPVIDGKGRFVGANFDRVWENITNDFGFDPRIARNVSVEVRYLLWNLEEVEHADALLRELGIPAKGSKSGQTSSKAPEVRKPL